MNPVRHSPPRLLGHAGRVQATAAKSAQVGEEMSDDVRWIRTYVVKEDSGTRDGLSVPGHPVPKKVREQASAFRHRHLDEITLELAQDVAHVHVHRARAEEQVVRDLAVRAADGDEPHDLALAARRPPPSASASARPTEPRRPTRRARHLARRLGGQRARAELARGAVGVAQALERELALARGGQRDARAQLDLRALERHVEVAVQLDRAGELLGGGVRVALEQRDLGERMSAASASGWPCPEAIAGQRLGARVRAGAVAAAAKNAAPSAGRRARSGGRRCAPSGRGSRGSARAASAASPSAAATRASAAVVSTVML